jgi:hypothetical protein
MDKLTKMWQVWNRTKSIVGWNVTHTKLYEQTGLKTAQMNNKKIRATSDMFKVEHCGSSLRTSNRKNEFEKKLLISKQNRKRKVL